MSFDAKQVRGQLRQILNEELPKAVTEALTKEAYAKLQVYVQEQLNRIQQEIQVKLLEMEARQKAFLTAMQARAEDILTQATKD
jgi:hypothetical protein